MAIPKFDIPEIPPELVDECKRKSSKVWALTDLDLCDPALLVTWARQPEPGDSHASMAGCYRAPIDRMIREPETDVRAQLARVRQEIEFLEAGAAIGIGTVNYPCLHLIHFGTGPLATAFGSRMVVRVDEQPFFEPAVHTPEEVMRLRKPDLRRAGVLPAILERIEYYNEATQGKIPLNVCDTASPWTMATQIWHYEDMLEAIKTAPEAVHYLLDLVTDCIIEWNQIQETRMVRQAGGKHGCLPWPWHPRGYEMGDDTMVAVSPRVYEEFFLPYNNRIAREYGGLIYHCCMRYDFQFPAIIKTEAFMGLDADPDYNNLDKIEAALSGRGVWWRAIGDLVRAPHGREAGRRDELPVIRRLRGKVGLFLGVHGEDRQDAIDRARRLLDAL
jgi:hypothetical protein